MMPRKSSAEASCTKGMIFSIEPEPSTTRPIVSGSFSAISKPVTAWGRPSSWTEKSASVSPFTKRLSLSIAETWSCTTSTRTFSIVVFGPFRNRRSLASLPSSPIAVARRNSPREYSVIGIVTSYGPSVAQALSFLSFR